MRWERRHRLQLPAALSVLAACLAADAGCAPAFAQDNLPKTRLFVLTPNGGKAGSSLEVTFSGSDLEEPQALLFSHPGIKAEPMVPPAPPADPKKKETPPKPPVTKFKITIAADAPLGVHDARFIGKYGVSNPRAFVVGDLNEVAEKEPNNDVPEAQRIEVNTTVTGAIGGATDVDYFVLAGKKGQRVVASCLASTIDSRLHAGLELYDGAQRRLAYNVRYDGNDALADLTLPADGDYFLRLFEFSHTEGGGEHFYRLSVTTGPWIDSIYPPVVEPSQEAKVTLYGRNLPGGVADPSAGVDGRALEKLEVTVKAPSDPRETRRLKQHGLLPAATAVLDGFDYQLRTPHGASNSRLMAYAVAPVVLDNEANDTLETAQEITVPCEIAGRVEKLRDRDWYIFSAKKDQVFSIDLSSARLGAPTDMYFVLRNVTTKQDLGEYDDDGSTILPKFFTSTEDPSVHRFVVPADGKYQLMVASRYADNQAGPQHVYRVRIAPEKADFRVFVLPSDNDRPDSLVLPQGGNQAFDVVVWRKDGWAGSVTLLADGLPTGVTCAPQVLGPAMNRTTLVLSAAADAPAFAGEFRINGAATINGLPEFREARLVGPIWPVTAGQNIPMASRVERNLVLAVREKALLNLATSLDKARVFPGDKVTLTLRLSRLSADFKQPMQVTVLPQELPANLTLNNNQPVTIAEGKNEATMLVDVKPNVAPGIYNLIVRGTAQIPYNKDPKAAQKPATNVVQPSTTVELNVVPKQVVNLSASPSKPAVKPGEQAELVVKISRLHDFTGALAVKVDLPGNAKGLTIAEGAIPVGKDEVKLAIQVATDAAPVNLANINLQATALAYGDLPLLHEAKFNLNIVK